ncbi:MAG: tetratricopeptide repeat protein [Candidatus Dadabacteria bacterium]|nr:MAG: tetratricopeptide repeat protein [Candidatus Dadabacteria bacterium]
MCGEDVSRLLVQYMSSIFSYSFLRNYFEWIKTWKSLPVISWVRAAECYKEEKFALAAELYEKGLASHPFHEASYCARLDLAHCYFKEGRYEDAKQELKGMINLIPELKEAYVRLARIHIWLGEYLEAVWTMRRALREIKPDGELVGIFLGAVLDNGGPGYLLDEAREAYRKLSDKEKQNEKLIVSAIKLEIYKGDYQKGRSKLSSLASGAHAPFDAVLAYGEVLLREGRISIARQHLRRALQAAPNHPKVLTLFASSYLKSGPYYNPDYAKQLATSACQNSNWSSPEALHILAESYKALDDRVTALATALRAKEAGSKLLSNYRDVKTIEELIKALSQSNPNRIP